jgi:hypothetical protein
MRLSSAKSIVLGGWAREAHSQPVEIGSFLEFGLCFHNYQLSTSR